MSVRTREAPKISMHIKGSKHSKEIKDLEHHFLFVPSRKTEVTLYSKYFKHKATISPMKVTFIDELFNY